jgi:undecaprenyl-diphosphatase
MDWKSIILGSVQGLTEFFPISSSAHLIFFHHFFFREPSNLWFDVILHGGTWVAVLFYLGPFYRRLFREPVLIVNVLLATIPAGLLGYLLEERIENYFRLQLPLISLILLLLGIPFLLMKPEGTRTLGNLTFWESFLVGCAQALALFPGVSRSGITLLVLLSLRFKREEAVLFSFLLSVTTIGGAFLKGIYEARVVGELSSTNLWSGFLSSFGFGILACFFLLRTVKEKGLRPFGYYRLGVGAAILLLLLLFKTGLLPGVF